MNKEQKEFVYFKPNRGSVYTAISKSDEGLTREQIMQDLGLNKLSACKLLGDLYECGYIKKLGLTMTPVYRITDTDKKIIRGLRKALLGEKYRKIIKRKKVLNAFKRSDDFIGYSELMALTRLGLRELIPICTEAAKKGILIRTNVERNERPVFKLAKNTVIVEQKDTSEIRHEMARYKKNEHLRNLVNSAFGGCCG